MNRHLFALLVDEPDEVSLAALDRAITYAPRTDNLRVWRAFVRSCVAQLAANDRNTQRIRICIGADRCHVGRAEVCE